MKKRIYLILIASLLLLCACQPTPESSIIVGKDQQQMIKKAQEEASYASSDASAQTVDWAARLGVPEHYTASLKSVGGRLTVEVDADVIVPDAEMPVVHVSPRAFTDKDAQRFVKALLGDDPKCIPWSGDNRTKAMYERMILEWKDALDRWEDYGCLIWDMYDTAEEFEEALQKLIAEAAEAPDTLETFSPVYEWEPAVWHTDGGEKTYGDAHMRFLTLNEDGTRSMLSIYNGADVKRSSISYYRDYDGLADQLENFEGQWSNELSITTDEARVTAEAVLREMGIDHLTCSFSKFVRCYRQNIVRDGMDYEPGWLLVFTPAVNGAALTYTHRTGVENNEYRRFWQYERCYLLVDERGVSVMHYYDACKADEIKVAASALLPFNRIIEIFEKMVLIVDNQADAYGVDRTYRITSVRLGMVSIPEQNGEGGYMVPCWDFMGDVYTSEEFPASWKRMGMTDDGSQSYLTINAIDGSIITRNN